MNKFILTAYLLMFYTTIIAQINESYTPLSFKYKIEQDIPIIRMKSYDTQKLLTEDALNSELKKPYRFGKVFDVDLSVIKEGRLYELSDNQLIYQLSIKSDEAKTIGLVFKQFHIPENSKLFVYSKDKNYLLGAFTSKNNRENSIFPISNVTGNKIIIEYNTTKNDLKNTKLVLGKVISDYRNILKKINLKGADYCEVNINCDVSEDYQKLKHSVCKFTYTEGSSSYFCTGALINNSSFEDIPYFLTANHCISSENSANSMVLYFNYEALNCSDVTGPENQTMSGASLVATAPNTYSLDFALVELNDMPPKEYKPYFAGWSRIEDAPDSTICIHHPQGDIKKISKDSNKPIKGDFPDYNQSTHWQILNWESGTTESGSSGSPLFNPDGRIIGDLTGGEASCDNNINDYYQMFHISWNSYGDSKNQLKYWLNPTGNDPEFINGYDPYDLFSQLPKPLNLIAEIDNKNVILNWDLPELPGFNDGFENYPDFEINNFGEWAAQDNDQLSTIATGEINFKNEAYIGSFIIFNPNETTPANQTGWEAYSGNKSIACFPVKDGSNDDWLITPQLSILNGDQLTFWAKSKSSTNEKAKIKIYISDRGTDISADFVEYSTDEFIEISNSWTQYVMDLSSYDKKNIYIAINCLTDNSSILFLDDFELVKSNSKMARNGFKIYRNGESIATIYDSYTTTFTDFDLTDGIYNYYVSAIYNSPEKESEASNIQKLGIGVSNINLLKSDKIEVYPNPAQNFLYIEKKHNHKIYKIELFDNQGKLVKQLSFKDRIGKKICINCENIKSGFYNLKICTDKAIFTNKIIIK